MIQSVSQSVNRHNSNYLSRLTAMSNLELNQELEANNIPHVITDIINSNVDYICTYNNKHKCISIDEHVTYGNTNKDGFLFFCDNTCLTNYLKETDKIMFSCSKCHGDFICINCDDTYNANEHCSRCQEGEFECDECGDELLCLNCNSDIIEIVPTVKRKKKTS